MAPLAPQLRAWLQHYNRRARELQAQGFQPTPSNAREGLADLTRMGVTRRPAVAWVQDDLVPGPRFSVPIRIYHPAPATALPVLVYYHGGGHMAGSIAVYDPICREAALAASHIVVAPDYRLAPECPYPAGVEDAYWVAKNVWAALDARGVRHQRRLSLAGDSGGGALCATVAHRAQHDGGLNIRRQVLIYPSLDYTMGTPSMAENGAGYLLERERIGWYFDHYFQGAEDRRKASPLYQEFSDRLPETLVVTAQFCPLRDEGAAYAEKIRSTTAVYVEHLHLEDMIHAFLNLEDLAREACQKVYTAMGRFLNR